MKDQCHCHFMLCRINVSPAAGPSRPTAPPSLDREPSQYIIKVLTRKCEVDHASLAFVSSARAASHQRDGVAPPPVVRKVSLRAYGVRQARADPLNSLSYRNVLLK